MTDMLRQIFKQLWFYRRSNSWLFIELVIIIAVSWFLVHQTWTPRYRINNVPDGIKSEGVYIVSFDLLQPGHKDYDPQADGEEAWSRDFSRIMDRIRSMPEVQCAVPTTDFFPGLGPVSAGGLQLDSLTYISLLSIERAMGENDFEVFGYEVVWPKDGRIDDSQPMSMIITEDLAEYVFPGENPIGKNLESACAEPDMEYGWTTPIVGVIRSIRQSGSSDNIPAVFMSVPDFAAYAMGEICCAFRLNPDVDADKFLADASREWRKSLRFGNYRIEDVFSYQERIDGNVRMDVLDRNFIWSAVFISAGSCLYRLAPDGGEAWRDRCTQGNGRLSPRHSPALHERGLDHLRCGSCPRNTDNAQCAAYRQDRHYGPAEFYRQSAPQCR